MKCPSYREQSLTISNKYTLGVEKFARNVADDVVSSKGGVIMNTLSML